MKRIVILLFVIISIIACEKDADIKLDEMPPVPVIEGYFSNFAPDSYFKITMSKGFQRDTYEYELVTDAQLSVTDSQGNQIHFYPDSEGVYRTTTDGIPGETYTLNLIKDSHHLTAQSTMPEQISINNFEFNVTTQTNGDANQQLILYFNDPENTVDYYMVKIYYLDLTNVFYQYEPDLYFDDSNYNNAEHSLSLSYVHFNGPGTYKIKLFHFNKAYLEYLNTLEKLADMGFGEGPFQIAVPGNPETNVQGGIGYFATTASDSLVKQIN